MKRASVVLAALAVMTFAWAVTADQPRLEERSLTWTQAAMGDAQALYAELCATCHGADAKGAGPAAEALAEPIPDLTLLSRSHRGVYPADDVFKAISGETRIVAHRTIGMPVWGKAFEDVRPDHKPAHRFNFARQRIGELVDYLASLQVL